MNIFLIGKNFFQKSKYYHKHMTKNKIADAHLLKKIFFSTFYTLKFFIFKSPSINPWHVSWETVTKM